MRIQLSILVCLINLSSSVLAAPVITPEDDDVCSMAWILVSPDGEVINTSSVMESISTSVANAVSDTSPAAALPTGSNATVPAVSGFTNASATTSSVSQAALSSPATSSLPSSNSSALGFLSDTSASSSGTASTSFLNVETAAAASSSAASSSAASSSAASATSVANSPSAASSTPSSTTATSPTSISTTGRKGVGCWEATDDVKHLLDQGVAWTYEWGPTQNFEGPLPESIEFVPMIATLSQSSDASTIPSIKQAGSNYTHILSYNEPDVNGITVEDAINLWPSLVSTGLKIGSPAPANTKLRSGDWFYDMMEQVKSNDLQLDFIALHHYADDFNVANGVATFQQYVESVYQMYQLPIWITEYAMVNYDNGPAQVPDLSMQAQYATAATQMLQSLPYVERYAWFALPSSSSQPDTNLYDCSGSGCSITVVGEAYKQL